MTDRSQTEPRADSTRDMQPSQEHTDEVEVDISNSHLAAEQLNLPRLQRIGDYELYREIGRGGMGIVYEAMELTLQRKVALKILPVSAHLDPMLAKRFHNESRAAAQLNHANIIPVYAVGACDGVNYFAMQLVEGRNLNQVIRDIRSELINLSTVPQQGDITFNDPASSDGKERRTPKRKSSPGGHSGSPHEERVELSATDFVARSDRHSSTLRAHAVARLGTRVASALQHAHEMGVIHRDIKPSNLILDNQGKVWVTDFGLALVKNTPSLTRTGVLLGTLRYMSPEQATGVRALVDHRTDIYSLAVTLCELLTLKRLVVGKTTEDILRQIIYEPPVRIQRIDPAVPEDLAVILEKAMAKNPLERYMTAGEMAEDLNRFLRSEAIVARRPSVLKRSQRWLERHRAITSILGATLAFVFVMSLVATGLIWRALHAEGLQHELTLEALSESEGLRLIATGMVELSSDPGLSLVLARKGEHEAPGFEANRVLQEGMDVGHEYASVVPRELVSAHVVISPDANTAVTSVSRLLEDDEAYPAILHSMRDGHELRKLDSGDRVTSAAYSPGGNFIVTASTSSTGAHRPTAPPPPPVLWETSTGKKLRVFAGATLPEAHPAIFDRDGQHLVLCQGNEAHVYELAGGPPKFRLRGHAGPVIYAEFSPNGQRILTVAEDDTTRVWDSQTGRELRPAVSSKIDAGRRTTAKFVASSEALVVAERNSIKLYAAAASDDVTADPLAVSMFVRLAVNRSLDQVASYGGNEAIILSSKDLEPICEINVPERITDIRFHPSDSQVLVICGKHMFLYDSETAELLSELRGHRFSVTDACFAPDGDKLASVSNDRTFRLWHAKSGLARRSFPNPRDVYLGPMPYRTALSPNDELLAVCSRRDYVTSVRDADGATLPGESLGMVSGRRGDSERLVLIHGSTVTVNESSTAREIYRGSFSEDVTLETKLVDQGRHLLVHTMDFQVDLVDLRSRSRRRLGDKGERISTVVVAADTSFAVLAADSGRYFAVDSATGDVLWSKRHDVPIADVDISPDQQQLALVDRVGNLEVWNIDGQEPLATLQATERPVSRVRFVHNGQRLVTWDALRNREVWCHQVQDLESYSAYAAEGMVRLDAHPTEPLLAIGTDEQAVLWNFLEETVRPLADRGCQAIRFSEGRVAMLLLKDASQPAALHIRSLSDDELVYEEPLNLAPTSLMADLQRNLFLVTQQGYSANVFRFETGEPAFTSSPHAAPILFAEFSAATRGLVTVSGDGLILITDETGNLVNRLGTPGQPITAAAMDEKGEVLLTGSESGDIAIWSVQHGTRVTLSGHKTAISSIRVDPSGIRAVSVAPGEPVRYWDLRTHNATQIAIPDALHAELSEKSILVIAGSVRSFSRKAWLLADAQSTAIDITQPQGTSLGLFSSDGSRIGLLAPDGQLDVLRLSDRKVECSVSDASEHIVRFAFAPDGESLLTAQSSVCSLWSIDKGAKITQVAYTKGQLALSEHWDPFSHDAKWFITSGPQVRKYARDPAKVAQSFIHRELTEEERRRFRLDLTEVLRKAD